jgi:hypothetical protein
MGETMDEGVHPVTQPTVPPTPPAPPAAPIAANPVLAELRALKRWMIVATVLLAVGLSAIVAIGAIGLSVVIASNSDSGPDTPSVAAMDPAGVKPITDAVTAAYGDKLESVEVTQVELVYDGQVTYRPYAVVYRLVGFDRAIEGMVDDPSDLIDYGLVPTAGGVGSGLSDKEFADLRGLWSDRSAKPMGFTYSMVGDNTSWEVDDKVTYGGKTYLAQDLWAVSEGWTPVASPVPEGSIISGNELVFHLDPKTDSFSYVGSGPSQSTPYPAESSDWDY